MMRYVQRGAAAIFLIGCSSAAACAESDPEYGDLEQVQSLEEDTGWAVTPGAGAGMEEAGGEAVHDADGEEDPAIQPPILAAPTPRAAPPLSSRQARRPVAKVVHGVAELQVDAKQFVPADYLRAELRGGRVVPESLTGGDGEFFFKDVPAGTYELTFLTVTKDARQVYATAVEVGSGERVRLPPVHIPIDSVKSRKR